MTIYSSPPPARSFSDDKPTLLVCWWCTSFAGTIIMFRVAGRYLRTEKLFKEDWLALACLIPLLIRMTFVHVVLLYGTNNVITGGLSDDEIWHRSIGSRMVLASRVFYAATLWMNKLTISEFFKRLTPLHLWKPSYELAFQTFRWFLLVSFIAVVIADIAECQPINAYWQVVPDPGPQCRQGYAQLITLGAADVITDVLLVVFPIPIILLTQMGLKLKFNLTMLFGLSLTPAAITLLRIPNIIDRQSQQQYRSLWASIEILGATAVANALVLGSFVRDRGVKKQKYKFGSITDSMERGSSRRETANRYWGSDEDLVRGLGLAVDPKLRGSDDEFAAPRLAPMGVHGGQPLNVGAQWGFPNPRADFDSETNEYGRKYSSFEQGLSPGDVSFSTPRKVSFFDVGGLLDDEDSPKRRPSAMAEEDRNQSSRIRKGSAALLHDLGGLLVHTVWKPPRSFQNMNGSEGHNMELQSIAQVHTQPETRDPPTVRRNTVASFHDTGGR